jgi:nucleoside recognition membrane protein YjiH
VNKTPYTTAAPTSAAAPIRGSDILRFALPSAAGLLLFLAPVRFDGKLTIPIAVIVDQLYKFMGASVRISLVTLCVVTALASIAYTWIRPSWLRRKNMAQHIFETSQFWVLSRIAGAVFGIMYYMRLGPELFIGEDTGGTAFVNIGEQMLLIYMTSCLFLPLLTNYGAMEFFGTLVRPLFIRLFKLPGRAAIDAVASFVAAASVGLLITIEQYRNGAYTTREAAVVATNFSVVSVPFAVLIASVAKIDHVFFPWYLSVALACIVAAIITPRIPPLSKKPDAYYQNAVGEPEDTGGGGVSLPRLALQRAVRRAQRSPGVSGYASGSLRSMAEAVFGVIGASMGLVVAVMILALHTPVFGWISKPLVPLLSVMGLGQADLAASGFFVGFLDQFLPAVVASRLDVELTRFVLAGMSICQLIYISEVGVLLLRSILPLKFKDLVLIFLLRTAILLPVLVIAGHLIVGQ